MKHLLKNFFLVTMAIVFTSSALRAEGNDTNTENSQPPVLTIPDSEVEVDINGFSTDPIDLPQTNYDGYFLISRTKMLKCCLLDSAMMYDSEEIVQYVNLMQPFLPKLDENVIELIDIL